ncbi:MAG: hypothetical protein IKE52_00210 [Mogibacterium sp.]|nr:hypothetical protein [Mogibacterium sp.]
MSIIDRNDYGAIGVNKNVIEKIIIEDVLKMKDRLILCTKKGKPVKENRTPWIDPDYYDAIDFSDKRGAEKVSLNIIVMRYVGISELSDAVFEIVENAFELMRLKKPRTIKLKIRGVMSDVVSKRNIEVVREND